MMHICIFKISLFHWPITKVETKWKACHKCVTTEDVVQTKIEKTNQLIENLQKTLDEIRCRTKTVEKEVGTSDGIETEKATEQIKKAEVESDGGETETERYSEEDKIAAGLSEVTEKPDAEGGTPHLQVPNVSLEESPEVDDIATDADSKTAVEKLDVKDDVLIDFPRPKTRRPCHCIEEDIVTVDKFRTAPEDGTGGMDEFDILQAKLNAIVESTESDHSVVSEPKLSEERSGGGPRVSFVGSADWLFKDFVSRGPSEGTRNTSIATQSTSTATPCVSTRASQTARPSLVRKNLDGVEIAPKKPQLELSIQVLPALNICREPVVKRLVSFFIDSNGETHVTYKMDSGNVGFFEMQSSSLTTVFSADNSEVASTRGRIHEKKVDGDVSWQKHSKEKRSTPDGRHSRVKRQKSFSDTDFYSIKGKLLSSETLDDKERKRVLQSYQLLDNQNKHDPGVLSSQSLDVISAIDEDVYKTYINPLGFVNTQATPSTYTSHKTKPATLEKLSSMKLLIRASESDGIRRKRSTKSDKSSQTDSKTIQGHPELEGDPKLYNIGLYKSTSTQMAPSEEIAIESVHDNTSRKKTLEVRREEEDATRKEIEIEGGVGVEYERIEKEESEGIVKPESSSVETRRNREVREEIEIKGGVGEEYQREEKKDEERGKIRPEPSSAETSRKEEEARKEREIKEEVVAKSTREKKKDEDREKIKPRVGSTTPRPQDAESSISYERISLSISYSTEESITEESSADVVQRNGKHSGSTASPDGFSTTDYQRQQRLKSGSYMTFKNLREKITKEHSFDVRTSIPDESDSESDEDKNISNEAVPTFISGLLESTTASLRRVIPHIRKSVKSAKSDIRQSTVFAGKSQSSVLTQKSQAKLEEDSSSELPRRSTTRSLQGRHQPSSGKTLNVSTPMASWVNPKDSDDETEMGSHHYHVAHVHVQGDSVPIYRRRFKPSQYAPSPLQAGRNGRYKDEEDLFCESNSPQYENSLHGRFRTIPDSLYKAKFNLDSSNSDTVTNADRVLSEGEVRCSCSASIGELHVCRRRRSPSRSRRPQLEDHASGIRKRRTYFNNWVTYYVNKNALHLNDSSSTS